MFNLSDLTRQEVGAILFVTFTVVWAYAMTRMYGEPKPGKHSFSPQSVKAAIAAMKILPK